MNDQASPEIRYEDFHAYHDKMSKTLRVTGTCYVEHGGVAVDLAGHEKPTFNPLMVSLDLVFTVTAESDSRQPVEWSEPWEEDGPQYTEVEFFARGFDVEPPPPLKIETIQ